MSNAATNLYSAANISCPWRGVSVIPPATVSAGDLAAAMFMYSGVFAEPTTEVQQGIGNIDWLKRRKPKSKSKVVRFSDFETREAYAAALEAAAKELAAEALPLSRVTETGEVIGDDELEDDEIILMALTRILH